MFCIIDRERHLTPIKSGFKTSSQANNWAKKNLPKDEVRLWGTRLKEFKYYRYYVRMR